MLLPYKSISFHLFRMLPVQCLTLFLSENSACVDDVVSVHVESSLVSEFNCIEDHYAQQKTSYCR